LNATEVIAEFRAKRNIYRTQADLEKVDSGSSSSESDDDDAKAKNKRAKKAAGHQLTAEILLNIPAEPREGTLPILQCTEAMQLDTLPQATLKRLQKMVPIIKLLPVPPKENHLIAFLRSAGFNRDDLDTNICARPAASQLNNIHNACILLTHGIGNTIPGKLPSLLAIFALAVSTAPLANCRRRRLDTPQEALQHAKRNLQSQRTKLALTLAIPRDHHLAVTHHSGFTPARARLFRSHQSQGSRPQLQPPKKELTQQGDSKARWLKAR
jgi:hypothetical protein